MNTFGVASHNTAVYFAQAGGGLGGLWWWIIPFLLIAAAGYYFVLIYPKRYLSEQFKPEVKDRLELENDYRATYAQIVGGAFVVLGFIGTVYSLRESHNLFELNQRGQEAERFSKAVGLIKEPDELSRAGGIFALETLADTYETDYRWPVLNVFAAYVRKSSCPEEAEVKDGEQEKVAKQSSRPAGVPCPKNRAPAAISTDIQEVLSYIARGPKGSPKDSPMPLNLSRTNLREANLTYGHLKGMLFLGVDGVSTNFTEAQLQGANFQAAVSTSGAIADLKCAKFPKADLRGAHFDGANLRGANFSGAIFDKYTTFTNANLKAANFAGTDLGELALSQKQLNEANVNEETTPPRHGKLTLGPEAREVKNNPTCGPPIFDGTWRFDKGESLKLDAEYEQQLPPQWSNAEGVTLVVASGGGQLLVSYETSNGGQTAGFDDSGASSARAAYNLDGTETSEPTPDGKPGPTTLKAAWSRRDEVLELTRESKLDTKGDKLLKTTDIWELSANAKLLIVTRYIEAPQGKQNYTLAFKKM